MDFKDFENDFDEKSDDERDPKGRTSIRLLMERVVRVQALYSDDPIRFVDTTDSVN